MNLSRLVSHTPALRAVAMTVLVAALAACSGTPKPKPIDLPANPALFGVRQAWKIAIPKTEFSLQIDVSGDTVTVASADGTVVAIDSR